MTIKTPVNPELIGDSLYFLLTNKDEYKNHTDIYNSATKDNDIYLNIIKKSIKNILKDYFNIELSFDNTNIYSDLYAGDIILIDNKRPYVITQKSNVDIPITWPKLLEEDKTYFTGGDIRNYLLIRPTYSYDNITLSTLKDLSKEALEQRNLSDKLLDQQIETFRNADKDINFTELGDGALQIGDLIFSVDPTQIAFNTQNGYQYFPTIRTQGNPKIPTPNQVKNISINLIFPNEDSINYQLLNLFAMFKRTPFVNIRNKDISKFFKEICYLEEWLSVALESINIQSVKGFPNTLQASITILPFDYRSISNGFQSLISMNDVEKQQAIVYHDSTLDKLLRKAASKFEQQSILSDKFIELLKKDIKKSPDFRNSIPFRAFYQSLIAERSSIINSFGEPVSTTKSSSYNLESFRPSNINGMLHEYRSSDNQEPIELEYSYIPLDFTEATKLISDQRLDTQIDTISQLNSLYDQIQKPEDIGVQLLTLFSTKEDFYEITQAKFDQIANSVLPTLVSRYNITIDQQKEKPIRSVIELLWRGLGIKTGVRGTTEFMADLWNIKEGRISVDSVDIAGYLNGVTFNDTETNGIGTFQWGIKKINEWLFTGTDAQKEDKKKRFTSFIFDLRQNIQRELGLIDTEQLISINPSSDSELFKVNKLPLQRAKVIIDNKNDIVVGWNLIFSNKFIPITLQAFKYPYYQHIGSEDISLSLNINSVPGSDDLKSKLSLLSERLHESVKIVTLNIPELVSYLDSRLTINAGINNIFNCFGISKVVFDSSNTVNINNQPNSWNTVVNFTQSNFTIADYHSITHVPSDNIAINEIAKILMSVEINNEVLTAYEYKSKDGTKLSLNDIIKIRYLEWSLNQNNENNIFNYIQNILSNNTRVTGDTIAQQYLNEFRTYYGSRIINSSMTIELNTIIKNNPEYKKVILLILSRIETLFQQKTDSLKQVIYPNKTFFQNWWGSLKNRMGSEANIAGGALALIVFFMIPPVGVSFAALTAIASTTTAFVGSYFIYSNALSLADATQIGIKDRLISTFGSVFSSMENSITSLIVLDFASKVIRDPNIYKTFINPKTIGNDTFENIELHKSLSKIPCYQDFELPNFTDIVIGPDFYLWNDLVDSIDIQMYINEALKRYAKVGKLTAMMTLTEASEILENYNNIISRTTSIDEDIQRSLNNILTEDILGGSTTTDNIPNIINALKNTRDIISLCQNNTSELEQNSEYNQKLLDDFTRLYKDRLSDQEFDYSFKILAAKVNKSSEGVKIDNMDLRKLNLIYTARMKTMLEIFEVYSVLNEYMLDNRNTSDNVNKFKSSNNPNMTKQESEYNSLLNLFTLTTGILKSPKNLTQKTLASGTWGSNSQELKKALQKKFVKGLAQDDNETYLSLPGIQNVQNYLFNKIGYYIRLNSFLSDYKTKGGSNATARIDFSQLPELDMLSFWNFRERESNEHKLKIVKDFGDSFSNKKDTTIKMFPTFKLFLIEEDKNITSYNFNDYYTHNAIQSIEVIDNKNSPSKTAVIKISNITNSLTDKMSLLRESEDLFGYSLDSYKSPNMFFGTLDIKPGTQIILKAGYAPYDNLLVPIFQGRIIDMNVGPMVELVCQSFGAQLNHEIVQHKFGLFSKEREHGDVASALLDMIPGLEKLGKKNELGLLGNETYDPRGLRNLNGKLGDRLLMSNILGNVSSMSFGSLNPRDENIYLEYSAANNIKHHPTFDWVVYDQTIWESLKELSLYHRDKIVTVKDFNNNNYSNNNYLRETLVIGDKAGYYKHTDAFSLSSIDYKKIDQAVLEWNTLKSSLIDNTILYNSTPILGANESSRRFGGTQYIINLTKTGKDIYNYLQVPLNSAIIQAHLLKNQKNVKADSNFLDVLINTITDNKFILNEFKELLTNLVTFSKFSTIDQDDLSSIDFGTNSSYNDRFNLFINIINSLKNYITNVDFIAEEYYNVKAQMSNVDNTLINNPQYKKIQQHHLITDASDIISNNISVNSNFSNVVNVYYVGEPNFKTSSLDKLTDKQIQKELNLWTVKAFGDQKDEYSRVLNSYQKNIDTNWFDIVRSVKGFYNTYTKANGEKAIKKLSGIENINIPNWNAFPSFVTVGVRLLQQQVEKMYQGTIEIVGNPNIKPYDILHIQDYTNDMHGVVEVEEVIHVFTPDRGYITIITPNLITYDRDPLQLQDVQVINQIFDYASQRRNIYQGGSTILGGGMAYFAAASIIAGGALGLASGGLAAIPAAALLFNGIVGVYKKYHKFLYDQMGNILGRDCVNFTSLLYHGLPYIAGFDGVDYTNLKTIMNHNVSEVKNPITRYLSYRDVFKANITTGWNPEEYDLNKWLLKNTPIINQFTGFGSSRLRSGFTQ